MKRCKRLKHILSKTVILHFYRALVPGIRHLISIPAGLAKMDLKKFILYTAMGSTIWHAFLQLSAISFIH
jgi:membrane protein DedA with SNARE-associated domain